VLPGALQKGGASWEWGKQKDPPTEPSGTAKQGHDHQGAALPNVDKRRRGPDTTKINRVWQGKRKKAAWSSPGGKLSENRGGGG